MKGGVGYYGLSGMLLEVYRIKAPKRVWFEHPRFPRVRV